MDTFLPAQVTVHYMREETTIVTAVPVYILEELMRKWKTKDAKQRKYCTSENISFVFCVNTEATVSHTKKNSYP